MAGHVWQRPSKLCKWSELTGVLLLLWMLVGGAGSVSVTVGTYNIWNVMFNWDVRKHHIAEMIRASNIDVIGLQEVRADEEATLPGGRRRTQVGDLQELLLPDYKWSTFQAGHSVTLLKGGALHEWQLEGLALLSRHPILKSRMQELSHHSRTDRVRRKVLHAAVMVDDVEIQVSVVHLSYDKWQQCNNVAEIMKYIRDSTPKYSVILGDFNTYNDYEGPLEGLNLGYFSTQNKCPKYAKSKNPTVESELRAYDDAWKVTHYGEDGFTFSNMPSPSLVSRPDRIFFSNRNFRAISSKLDGDGNDYARTYRKQITLSRRTAVVEAAKRTFYGESGGECVHDCGPHGSCRCGVCVRGGNENSCSVPDCRECGHEEYRRYRIVLIVSGIFAVQLVVALVQIVLAVAQGGATNRHGALPCFCRVPLSAASRRHLRRLHAVSCLRGMLGSCRNLAVLNLMISLSGILVLAAMAQSWFHEPLQTVDSVLPEELNPSDHLMISACLELL